MRNRSVSVLGVLLVAAVVLSAAGTPAPQGAGERRVIKLPTANAQLPFSDGVMVGNTLYLAGKIGVDPKTGKPPEDAEQEARIALDGIRATLAAAGMSMDDLVSVTVYCPDLSLYDKFNATYRTYFSKDFPARAFIGSGPLLRGGKFEVQGIAVRKATAQLVPAR
jgi:reactive intermediate/imine deaminase